MTLLFAEQPPALPGSAKYSLACFNPTFYNVKCSPYVQFFSYLKNVLTKFYGHDNQKVWRTVVIPGDISR